MKIAVLGAGMVGRTIALDLASNSYEVHSFDLSEKNLALLKERNNAIQIHPFNLKEYKNYTTTLAPFDFVVTAVPGFMGFETLKHVIEAGKNVADISFFPEDALELDALAKQKNVTVITDCGVAPGMSNYILGRYNEEMKVTAFECYVGGLPQERKRPFEYKAPFSPIDVIEEYTRPARLMEYGNVVTKPALTEAELMNFDGVGTLESFNTDGLRSILYTMPHIPNMKEKTLRYPGHIGLISSLQQAGFFNETPIEINGVKISPLEFTSKLLINEWKLGEQEEELTVMQVIVKGIKNGKEETIVYDMLDKYDTATKMSSMSRTTGYTCTATLQLIMNKIFQEKGVFPPELVGKHKASFDFVLNYLAERKVIWRKKTL